MYNPEEENLPHDTVALSLIELIDCYSIYVGKNSRHDEVIINCRPKYLGRRLLDYSYHIYDEELSDEQLQELDNISSVELNPKLRCTYFVSPWRENRFPAKKVYLLKKWVKFLFAAPAEQKKVAGMPRLI